MASYETLIVEREAGFAVLTFDYRGYGASLSGPMSEVENDLVRWALVQRPDRLAEIAAASRRTLATMVLDPRLRSRPSS